MVRMNDDTPDDDTLAVRAGDELDWPALEAHLRVTLARTGLDVPTDAMEVRQFGGGRANLTYLLRFGTLPLVLRRPPFGRIAPGAHDMGREYRVLSTLWRTFAKAPRALVFSDDEQIIGAPFSVMEYRVGVVLRDEVPESMQQHPDVGPRTFLALVDATLWHLPLQARENDFGPVAPEAPADQDETGCIEQRDSDIVTIGFCLGHLLNGCHSGAREA